MHRYNLQVQHLPWTIASSEETTERFRDAVLLYDDEEIFERENEQLWLYVYKVLDALVCDNRNEFVELVRHEQTVIRKSTGYVLAPSLLLSWAIIEGALRCAEVLLSGTAGVFVDLDAPRTIYNMLPIHEALVNPLPEFVELYIRYGARVNDKFDNTVSPYHLMQPIDVALQSLREKITLLWLPTQPVYDLIFTFCGPMEIKQAVICISHLLRRLPVEQTQGAICHYAREGSIVDLAVLLYIDAISDLGIFKGIKEDEYIALCEYVASNALSSFKGRSFFMIDGNGVAMVSMNKHVMKSLVLLLKIFYHTDFSLLGFDAVPGILIKRMNNAGFDLTNQENLEATEVVRCIKPVVELSQSVCAKALKSTMREYVQFRRVFVRSFHGTHSMPSSPHKSKAPWSFKPIPLPMLHASMDDGRGMVTKATHEWPQVLSSSLRRAWPDLASAAFRWISRV